MERSFEAYLWNIHEAGTRISDFTRGKTLSDYTQDPMLRAAVERMFEIIGEAMTQARQLFSEEASRLGKATEIISFRNRLAHGYHSLDDGVVWRIVQDSLPPLLAEVSVLLDEWHQA